jgi:hypothetical protein
MSKLSRRDFIKYSTFGLGGFFLTACGLNELTTPTVINVSPSRMPVTSTPPLATNEAIQSTPSPEVTAKPKQKGESKPTKQARTDGNKKPGDKNSQAAPTSANPDFIATEILGRPTGSSITVNVIPAIAMTLYYEYGPESGTKTFQTPSQTAAAGVPLETTISGLLPNTLYSYRIHYAQKAGPDHTFATQRAPGSTFSFDIQGDSHPERVQKEFDPGLYTRTLLSAAADKPDFYMTIGDDFSVDTLKTVDADTVRALYINQRQWLGQVGAPLFLVNGNHEQASMANLNSEADNVAVWAQTARNTLYPQPASDGFYSGDTQQVQFIGHLRDYYAFTWGDALFVVLDQYWHSPVTVDNQFGSDHDQKAKRDLWQVTIGDAQYQWFKQVLETSTAKYKLVFSHHVLGTQRGGIDVAGKYEWGDAANLAAHRSNWGKTIHQLMVDNHVTIYFQGHDHLFVHQQLDGVIYQTLPQPADPNYASSNAESYHSGDKFPNSGHVRVTVAPDGVKVDYIRSFLEKPDELAFSYHAG